MTENFDLEAFKAAARKGLRERLKEKQLLRQKWIDSGAIAGKKPKKISAGPAAREKETPKGLLKICQ